MEKKKILQSHLAEDPNYIKEHGLKLNPLYYVETQLKKPIKSLFEILIPDAETMFDEQVEQYKTKECGQKDLTQWFGDSVYVSKIKKKEKRTSNKKNKNVDIRRWFKKNK